MTIRFKCPHCKKSLAVKDELAGRKGACPACKKVVLIPVPAVAPAAAAPVDIEAMAAAALAEEPQQKPVEKVAKPIKFTCAFCDEESEFPADMAGKKAPCPACKRIIKVPEPKDDKPKDWRELIKKGPSAALINQPEQLEGAWGAEVKTKVSGAALEEAGAIVEYVEPVGVLGWLKRGFITVLFLAVLLGGLALLSRQKSIREQKADLQQALDAIKDPKLAPVLVAEVQRGAGVIYLRDDRGDAARDAFKRSKAYLNDEGLDAALGLVDLAIAQCELGGRKDPLLTKDQFDWQRDVQTDLETTLTAIHNMDVKVWAVRRLGTRLFEKKQPAVAIALATSMVNASSEGGRSPVLAPQVALLLARDGKDDVKSAEKALTPPQNVGKGTSDLLARSAYAEGHMRRGQFEEAKNLVQDGPDGHRLDACLAAGSIVAADPKRNTETQFFFQEAYKLYSAMPLKERPSPWQILQLAKLGLAAGAIEEAKELAKALQGNYRARWQLEKIRLNLDKASGVVPATIVEEVTDEKSVHRALAWCLFARHQARLNLGSEVSRAAEEVNDPAVKAMMHLGLALGEQDRRQ